MDTYLITKNFTLVDSTGEIRYLNKFLMPNSSCLYSYSFACNRIALLDVIFDVIHLIIWEGLS